MVLGPHAPWSAVVQKLAAGMPVATSVCKRNIAELMTASDLIIGAGGATTWERCSLEFFKVIPIAKNQEEMFSNCKNMECTRFIGTRINRWKIRKVVKALLQEKLKSLSVVSSFICDGCVQSVETCRSLNLISNICER